MFVLASGNGSAMRPESVCPSTRRSDRDVERPTMCFSIEPSISETLKTSSGSIAAFGMAEKSAIAPRT